MVWLCDQHHNQLWTLHLLGSSLHLVRANLCAQPSSQPQISESFLILSQEWVLRIFLGWVCAYVASWDRCGHLGPAATHLWFFTHARCSALWTPHSLSPSCLAVLTPQLPEFCWGISPHLLGSPSLHQPVLSPLVSVFCLLKICWTLLPMASLPVSLSLWTCVWREER